MHGTSLLWYGNQSGGRSGGGISRMGTRLPAFAPCSSTGIGMLPPVTPSNSHVEACSNFSEDASSSLAALNHSTDASASFAGASRASSGDCAARSLVLRREAAAQSSCFMARSSQPEASPIRRAARMGCSAARPSVASMTRRQALIRWSEDSMARRVRRKGRVHDRRRSRSAANERTRTRREWFAFLRETDLFSAFATLFSFTSLRRMRFSKVARFSPNCGNSEKILQKLYKCSTNFVINAVEIRTNVLNFQDERPQLQDECPQLQDERPQLSGRTSSTSGRTSSTSGRTSSTSGRTSSTLKTKVLNFRTNVLNFEDERPQNSELSKWGQV